MMNSSEQGYLSKQFALTQSNAVIPLQCGGYLIERPIPHTELRDAASPYPLFCSPKYSASDPVRAAGSVPDRLITVTLVLSPLFAFDAVWEQQFDRVSEYKSHFIVDLASWTVEQVSRHHLKNVKAFSKRDAVIRTELPCSVSARYTMYRSLMERHHVTSAQPAHLTQEQLEGVFAVPGAYLFETGEHDSWSLFYVIDNDVYYHLNASSESGYKKSASYGIMFEAIQYFKQSGLRYLVLGAGAGMSDSSEQLAYFKEHWGTFSRRNFVLGKILDRGHYSKLAADKDTTFFPAYRRLPAAIIS